MVLLFLKNFPMRHLWTKREIIDHLLTSDQIISFYLGEQVSLHKKICSPFRENDPKPSVAFYEHNGEIFWTDFGKNFTFRRDGIGFVRALFSDRYNEAVNRIYDDIILKKITPPKAGKSHEVTIPKTTLRSYLTSAERAYWADYEITAKDLVAEQIYALDSLAYNNRVVYESTLESPKFYYHFGEESFKIYMPLDRDDRFRSFNITGVIERYNTLPRNGDSLIITSSTKDSLVVKKVGHNAINPTGETTLKPILNKYTEWEERFKNIFIMLDNDKTGNASTEQLIAYSNWRWKKLPFSGAKDQSDLVKSRNLRNLAEQISYGKISI